MVQSGQFSFDEARTAFDIADINGDGEIDIAEFVQLMFPNAAEIISQMKRNFQSADDVVNTFNSWDLNKGRLHLLQRASICCHSNWSETL